MFPSSVHSRLEAIAEAKEIVIALKSNKYMDRLISDCGEENFLKSVARRAKEHLMWRLVAEGHTEDFPKEIVWSGENLVASPTRFKVVMTVPKGEVQVTPATLVVCRIER
jgi:hypothetical protein